jgi:RNA-directed DNA polymerase
LPTVRAGGPIPAVGIGGWRSDRVRLAMRSVPVGSFRLVSDPETLWYAWRTVRRGKRRGASVAAFELEADRRIFALSRALRSGAYRPAAAALRTVRDPKLRLIAAPAVADRILHRALLDAIGPTYERGYFHHCFTRGPGVGMHHAVLAYLGQLRGHPWRCQLDIAKYFPSVDLARLESLLFRRLADPDTRLLVSRLLDAGARVYRSAGAREILGPPPVGRRGLALGSYLSQWCGNFYLDGLDQFIKRELKVPGYLRYMDDFVLFDDDPGRLALARSAIADWLARERGLALKPRGGQVRPAREAATFLGYRVSRSGICPGRKLRRRFAARVRAAADSGDAALERCLVSYRGLLLFPGV